MEYFKSKTGLNIVVSTDEGESVGLLEVICIESIKKKFQ